MARYHDSELIVDSSAVRSVTRVTGQGVLDGQYGLRFVLVLDEQLQTEEVWYKTAELRNTAFLTLRVLLGEGHTDGILPPQEDAP